MSHPLFDEKITRRTFLKCTALLGGSAIMASKLKAAEVLAEKAEAGQLSAAEAYELSNVENMIQTVCLQCNTGCGIKVKLMDGVAVKIDGNPFSPWTMTPQLPYATPTGEVGPVDGALCPKGQAGIQTAYDPYRIVKVLKRDGKRGENKWKAIEFDQAINEIVKGGRLFAHVSGEENREVEGLRDLFAVTGAGASKALAEGVDKLRKKKITIKQFKSEYRDHLDKLIDPNKPDLGPKNNQLVFAWGRLKGGRGDLIKRFTTDAFGSVNAHGHTTVCQGSLYFTGKAMSEQYDFDAKEKKAKWTGGAKFFWEADDTNAEFVIYAGVSPFEGNYLTYRAPRITDANSKGTLKFAVVDPRFSNLASKAWKWVPNKPGSEGAMALALIRWIIDNKRYDAKFLSNANKAAAEAGGEKSWSNASWLVKLDKDGKPGEFLRAKDLGLAPFKLVAKDKTPYELDGFVALVDGKPVAIDPNDKKTAVVADPYFEGDVQGHSVATSLVVLHKSAKEKSMSEWAEICGVAESDLVELAREFTSHGKKAVADIHRGVSQHTNGYYNCLAWYSLNLLVGNFDHKGGLIKATTYDYSGDKANGPFNFKKLHPVKLSAFGVDLIRANSKYEDSSLFEGYPSKRQWYPLASDIYQEIVPSLGEQYPYPIKAMILYMGSPVYALPAGNSNVPYLADVEKLPLFITSDIVVGETSVYADYIFPDSSYLERWEFQGSHPTIAQKVQPVRQPAIAPLTETVKIRGLEMPINLESMIIALATELGLSGFGVEGLKGETHAWHQDDFYLRMVANLAFGEKEDGSEAVPDADAAEISLFLKARRHLPKSVFDPKRWKKIVGSKLWPKVVYVLNRGGRFQDYEKSYKGEMVSNAYGKQVNMYCEKTATTKNSMTGKKFSGIAKYEPFADSLGRPVKDDGYPLTLITHRQSQHCKSRTVSNYWLLQEAPENHLLINSKDARALGLSNGDSARVVSSSNPEGVWDLGLAGKKDIIAKIEVTEGMRPGVVSFSLGFGHWAYGANDVSINGSVVKGDKRRLAGFHANASMRLDPHIKNTCLTDPIGASAVFYDTKINLVRV